MCAICAIWEAATVWTWSRTWFASVWAALPKLQTRPQTTMQHFEHRLPALDFFTRSVATRTPHSKCTKTLQPSPAQPQNELSPSQHAHLSGVLFLLNALPVPSHWVLCPSLMPSTHITPHTRLAQLGRYKARISRAACPHLPTRYSEEKKNSMHCAARTWSSFQQTPPLQTFCASPSPCANAQPSPRVRHTPQDVFSRTRVPSASERYDLLPPRLVGR